MERYSTASRMRQCYSYNLIQIISVHRLTHLWFPHFLFLNFLSFTNSLNEILSLAGRHTKLQLSSPRLSNFLGNFSFTNEEIKKKWIKIIRTPRSDCLLPNTGLNNTALLCSFAISFCFPGHTKTEGIKQEEEKKKKKEHPTS